MVISKISFAIGLLLFTFFSYSQNYKTIHVFVALCDNKNQGIAPVPEKIGNGQNPYLNLYWGAGYGVKNYFSKKSLDWKLVKIIKNPEKGILERILFKHIKTFAYLLADAYDGAEIKQTIIDFLYASYGHNPVKIKYDSIEIEFGGSSDLLAYVGHNRLMDFDVELNIEPINTKKRETIIIACYSRNYFYNLIKESGASPLIWSAGLMSAEAYTLEWALDGWVIKETGEQIRERAAQAYTNYQKCGIKAARNLLRTGW